jgi:NADH-quinone oxidoreductase subunit M
MTLAAFIVVLLAGGLLAWATGRRHPSAARWISLLAVAADLVWIALRRPAANLLWGDEFDVVWIPSFGVHFHLAMDGLSWVMLLLTAFLGIVAVLASWREIEYRVGFFHFNLLWTLAGVAGVFLAVDLFLFYFFWEMMLIPMYLLIGVWGHERRIYAATKFFLFTQAGGLLMLAATLGLAYFHYRATGRLTFDYNALLGTPLPAAAARWLMLGFFVAFAIKLPMFPFHTWLPDAHTEAPTAGSVVLAGLLLKTGAYGMLRFAVPLFPGASREFGPAFMALGAVGALYGAVLAFAQTDLKRLVAYTSVSHLGFVLIGVYAFNRTAAQGAVMEMICHGLSTGALFALVGALAERTGTRDLNRLGGLWGTAPAMGGLAMVFAMASLGLPGLGNFIAEILVLAGSFRASAGATIAATFGLVLATVYSLQIMKRVFFGPNAGGWSFADLSPREKLMLGMMAAALAALGFFPQGVFDALTPVLTAIGGANPLFPLR